MNDKTYHALFICTANSARSIMAEALMNQLGKGRIMAYSAGSHPRGEVHPVALSTLARLKLPATGFRSKDWAEFATPDAPPLDFVFTVCNNAAGEVCPIWPGQPMTAHWGVPDPAAATGSQAQRERAFHDTALILKRRIELLLSLPLARLDAVSLRREIRDIGRK